MREAHEHIDYETGEVYKWQPPFIQMSRQPGIGANARQHAQSWRDFAVMHGTRIPVPRYLHQAWREKATTQQQEELEHEKYKRALTRDALTDLRLQAMEAIAKAQQELQGERRRL